jgi:hypothetical protein
MTESAVAFGTPLVSSGARLKGNARGAMVCALFGSAWMFWSAAFAPAAKSASLAFVSIVTLLICAWALLRVRVARRYEDSAADRARWAAIAPLFRINTAAEWVLGGGSVFALAHFGRYSLIPQFLGSGS